MDDRNEWDQSRARVHLACGLIIGGLVGLRIFFNRFTADSWPVAAFGLIAVASGFAWLAWRYLDDFWHWLVWWFRGRY